ncbi:MAG TPA: LLM class flavin-dependent oxidoreductase [Thermoleophilaceae bacterium]|nr:LLM class flavin-dependent oxidoreductase [Thermoleophilaceae bacterium]
MSRRLEYGAHLPLIAFGGTTPSLAKVREFARLAAELDYRFLCANDHLLFGRPWLDGPTALAAALETAPGITLATTVALPVIRGPVQTAKTLVALDLLSGGRLVAGVGPGSSERDYAAVGIPFEERWARFDEAVQALRSLMGEDTGGLRGRFYSTEGLALEPRPTAPGGPPLWLASWGSAAGMRRVARLGDGWLASGYNTTPARFREGVAALPESFPNGIATMWMYVTASRNEADRMVAEVLSPLLNRPVDALHELALPIGSAEACAERIAGYAEAGAQRVFVWPLGDELRQLEAFREQVVPLVGG